MNRKGIGVIVLLIVLGTIYFVFNPSKTALFPQCPFLLLTGFRCPGCGSQRAIHSLLHLDVVQAFSYNALLVSSIPNYCNLDLCGNDPNEKAPIVQ